MTSGKFRNRDIERPIFGLFAGNCGNIFFGGEQEPSQASANFFIRLFTVDSTSWAWSSSLGNAAGGDIGFSFCVSENLPEAMRDLILLRRKFKRLMFSAAWSDPSKHRRIQFGIHFSGIVADGLASGD